MITHDKDLIHWAREGRGGIWHIVTPLYYGSAPLCGRSLQAHETSRKIDRRAKQCPTCVARWTPELVAGLHAYFTALNAARTIPEPDVTVQVLAIERELGHADGAL